MQRILVLLLLVFSFYKVTLAQNKITIAVMDLTGEGVSNSESRIITSRLRTNLVNTDKFTVVEREKMEEILEEQGIQLSGCTSNECVVEAGKLLGVRRIVAGEFGKIGSLFTISIRMIDVQTGRILRTATEDCECRIEDVLTISIDNVAKRLAGIETTNKTANIMKYNSNFYQQANMLPKKKSPEKAFAMSFLIPGLGQYYNDDVIKGLIQQLIWLGGVGSLIATPAPNSNEEYYVAFGITAGICSWIWSMIDAPISSIKYNKNLENNKRIGISYPINKYKFGVGMNKKSLMLVASFYIE